MHERIAGKQKAMVEPLSKGGLRSLTSSKPVEPGIIDAVMDQTGALWFCYGTEQKHLWGRIPELAMGSKGDICARLVNIDPRLIHSGALSALRHQVSEIPDYRNALVANRPGWLSGLYVTGSGSVIKAPTDERELILSFVPKTKFKTKGSLADWQETLALVGRGQPLCLFALSFAFVGPLLEFFPHDYANPLCEFVGHGETGKTTLACLAMSVWAGDERSDCGGCQSWDLTAGGIDPVKRAHCDCLLALDESNLAGMSEHERRQFFQRAVFSLYKTQERSRFGDPDESEQLRVAVLSTTNDPLENMVQGSSATRRAAQSRMLTIPIPESGIWKKTPRGFVSAKAATEHLRNAVNENWGVAGEAFLQKLVEQAALDEDGLREEIRDFLDHARNVVSLYVNSPRLGKIFAATAVAGVFAEKWDIFPKTWAPVEEAVYSIAEMFHKTCDAGERKPIGLVKAYVKEHGDKILDASTLQAPLKLKTFQECAGVLRVRKDRKELFLSTPIAKNAFGDAASLVRALYSLERARIEPGDNLKLTIKLPRSICLEGRAYCLIID